MGDNGQDPTAQGQDPNSGGSGTTPQQTPTQAAGGQVFSADYVQTLRQEAAENRVSARQWEQKHKDLATQTQALQGQVSDLQGKLEAAQQAIQAERLDREAMTLASELGINDVSAAIALMDKGQISYGEDGKPQNLADVLKAVAQKHPFILGGGSAATNPMRKGTLTVEQIRQQSPQWINDHWEEVQAALSGT